MHAIHFNDTVRLYSFAGAEAMTKFLYPQESEDLKPEKDLAEFFGKYMSVGCSGTFSADWIR
ncbi:MAG: hypothetical protein P4L49_17760 [Desulfosporosinus sp.]|nr:hypothetical protein [Desulfosporosinus sp.]